MAQSASGEYRTLSQRLEAEEFQAGTWLPAVLPSYAVDISTFSPGNVPPVGFRLDSQATAFLRGAVFLDYDAAYAAEAVDYSGETQTPGSVDLLTAPEAVGPIQVQQFPSVLVPIGGVSVPLLTAFVTMYPGGRTTVSFGSSTTDGTNMHEFLTGKQLALTLSGIYSLV